MLLAFAATFFFLVSSNHTGWEPKVIAACAGVPVALFGIALTQVSRSAGQKAISYRISSYLYILL
ncbi:hypothetical protein H5410_007073 [Solanum commersonii]|uniref:Uncharacterized protein n=1 Tax=Solanum commersonii TaxID=4109 RepID=A0A9J6AD44_SOLCO|nr:hypothetical protein H5410_007073 [Solanum commersonii]